MNDTGYRVAVWSSEANPSESGIFGTQGAFGAGWDAAIALASQERESSREPVVATNSSRESTAVWLQNLKVEAASKDSGSPWSPPVRLSGQGEVPEVAMDDAGDVVAVWATASGEVQAAYKRAGEGWGPTTTLSFSANVRGGPPEVAIDAGGSALAVWVSAGEQIEAAELKP